MKDFIPPIIALKQDQKARAKMIRAAKSMRKNCQYGVVPHLEELRRDYRHHHIAYCLLRGRKLEEIEKPGFKNEPDSQYIERIKWMIIGRTKWYIAGIRNRTNMSDDEFEIYCSSRKYLDVSSM